MELSVVALDEETQARDAVASGERHLMMDTPDDSSKRTFTSLASAMAAKEYPPENYALIARFCEYIGIERYEDRGGYIKAVRPGGGPALEIHYGWTSGFRSEAEVAAAVDGDAPYWTSDRGTALWGIEHPINNLGHGGGPATKVPDYGTCPVHWMKLPPSGDCDQCE